MKKFCLIIMAILAWTAPAMAAGLVAEADRTIIPQGETFTLSIKYDGGKTNQQPDFAPLESDFSIFSMGTAFQHNFINGKMSQSQEWQLLLMPKKTGKIKIPALKLGKLSSNPLEVEIVPANQAQNMQNQNQNTSPYQLQIEAEVDNSTPFVQQEVNVTLKIYDTGGVQIDRVVPLDINENDWVIKMMGSPELESTVVNGKSTRVIKQVYAFFPQRSGKLTLPAFMVDGFYLTKSKNPMRNVFDDAFGPSGMTLGFDDIFAVKTPLSAVSSPIEIEVKPIPQQSQGAWWIPAQSVELFSEWKPNPPKFKVGEAVTRNIYIKAVGVIGNQLPNLDFKDTQNLRQYPEKPVTEMKIEGDKIASYRMISTVYIPSATGNVVVPEVKVNWFNVLTGKNETAVLPEMKVNVLPNEAMKEAVTENEEPADSAPNIEADASQQQRINRKSDADIEQAQLREERHDGLDKYVWIALAFLAGIVICYLILAPKRKDNGEPEVRSAKDYAKIIIKSAKANNLKKLRDELIRWARVQFKRDNITNLKDVAETINDNEMSEMLEALSAKLYNPESSVFDADKFILCFQRVAKVKKPATESDKRLPDLYD